DELKLDIGGDLLVESKQDYSVSENKSSGGGITLGGKVTSTGLSVNTSKGESEKLWVTDQTELIGRNGGTIKVGDTLTNTGAIIGSQNAEKPLEIDAKEIVANTLKDKDYQRNSGISLSGINLTSLVPQTGIQYGKDDVEQDTNATFTNVVARENGQQVDFEARGINTDLAKAQVITKDEHVEQIDTVLHTDLLNQSKREELLIDLMKTGYLIPEVAEGISQGISNPGQNVLGQVYENLAGKGADIVKEVKHLEQKLNETFEKYKNEKGEFVLNAESAAEIRSSLAPILKEYGKENYSIEYVRFPDSDVAMGISNTTGTVYINIAGPSFGTASEMFIDMKHEGGHGTYYNYDLDEKTVRELNEQLKRSKAIDTVIEDGYAGAITNSMVKAIIEQVSENLRYTTFSYGAGGEFGFLGGLSASIEVCITVNPIPKDSNYKNDKNYIKDPKKYLEDPNNYEAFETVLITFAGGGTSPTATGTISFTSLPTTNNPEELKDRYYSTSTSFAVIKGISLGIGFITSKNNEYIGTKFSLGAGFSIEANKPKIAGSKIPSFSFSKADGLGFQPIMINLPIASEPKKIDLSKSMLLSSLEIDRIMKSDLDDGIKQLRAAELNAQLMGEYLHMRVNNNPKYNENSTIAK
ncbi:MAG: hypothetical protein LBR17_05245, partial [Bacteroidales bacterium]|nr:hypothetical protein [Bacteroidales bacterium]